MSKVVWTSCTSHDFVAAECDVSLSIPSDSQPLEFSKALSTEQFHIDIGGNTPGRGIQLYIKVANDYTIMQGIIQSSL